MYALGKAVCSLIGHGWSPFKRGAWQRQVPDNRIHDAGELSTATVAWLKGAWSEKYVLGSTRDFLTKPGIHVQARLEFLTAFNWCCCSRWRWCLC
jgi:hypothetical protein